MTLSVLAPSPVSSYPFSLSTSTLSPAVLASCSLHKYTKLKISQVLDVSILSGMLYPQTSPRLELSLDSGLHTHATLSKGASQLLHLKEQLFLQRTLLLPHPVLLFFLTVMANRYLSIHLIFLLFLIPISCLRLYALQNL